MKVVLMMAAVSVAYIAGCAPSQQPEVRSTLRSDQRAHEGGASPAAPSAAPAVAAAPLGLRLHVSQRGITLNDVRIEKKAPAAPSQGSEDAALLAGLNEGLARERRNAGAPDSSESKDAHYSLTVEPDVPFRSVKLIMRARALAGYSFVRLSSGNATFDFVLDEWSAPGTEPLLEMHELGIRVDGSALSASVFHAAPSSINPGMFQRTLSVERSLPRDTSPAGLSAFTSAIADMSPPHCSESDAPCFDRIGLDMDDATPFGEMTPILTALTSGLRPAIEASWTTGASLRLSPLRAGTFYPGGYLPVEHIKSVVDQNFERIEDCYGDALRRDPKLTGTVRVDFTINLEGKVTKAVEAPEPSADAGAHAQSGSPASPIRDPKMVACVLSAFAKLQFARPERASTTMAYRIHFQP